MILWQDHPRIRGEKLFVRTPKGITIGSSPHTRGKAYLPFGLFAFLRIIPAYAGKRTIFRSRSSSTRDHPRIRGEKHLSAPILVSGTGSSPHTRGKVNDDPSEGTICRIIPAYAGKSLTPQDSVGQCRDHPRIRGEKFRVIFPAEDVPGSSPHTRGKVRFGGDNHLQTRIIPAYAGKRLKNIRFFSIFILNLPLFPSFYDRFSKSFCSHPTHDAHDSPECPIVPLRSVTDNF